jgi:hypothetical protein
MRTHSKIPVVVMSMAWLAFCARDVAVIEGQSSQQKFARTSPVKREITVELHYNY